MQFTYLCVLFTTINKWEYPGVCCEFCLPNLCMVVSFTGFFLTREGGGVLKEMVNNLIVSSGSKH